jgi:DNA (cytosine-5)-methyltransferase 1
LSALWLSLVGQAGCWPLKTWLRIEAGSFANAIQKVDLSANPAPTITKIGLGPGRRDQYWLEVDPMEQAALQDDSKPAYRVPLMDEVRALPWNGLKVATTFAGGGGSSTGYRMAGFRVVWANEFVPIATESYRANMAPDTILDSRDIRDVSVEDIFHTTGLARGELDLFDGSPPCQAFSTAGKRQRGWGEEKAYDHGAKQRNEDLFFEYVRLLDGLQPKVFVAENVHGLVKGVAKGYFLDILERLKACGYVVEARVLDAQWLGVPQQRNRLIFVGVRNDLGLLPAFPRPLPYRYSVREACPWIVSTSNEQTGAFRNGELSPNKPAPTVVAGGGQSYKRHHVVVEPGHGFAAHKACDVETEPAHTIRVNYQPLLVVGNPTIPQRSGNSFPRGEYHSLDAPCPVIHANAGAVGGAPCHHLETWQGPRSVNEPAPTVLTHGRADTRNELSVSTGTQKRKFTIGEVKRICSFPDDYELKGTYRQQWERLGNSVPPLMMRAVAETIRDEIFGRVQCKKR